MGKLLDRLDIYQSSVGKRPLGYVKKPTAMFVHLCVTTVRLELCPVGECRQAEAAQAAHMP